MSSISPILRYRDPHAAIEFLTGALGFERHAVHEDGDGTIKHAELRHGTSYVMFGSPAEDGSPIATAPGTGAAYVVVDDPDALHDRAKAAGANIVMGLTDQDYGSREFAVRDPEGNLWCFGTYAPASS